MRELIGRYVTILKKVHRDGQKRPILYSVIVSVAVHLIFFIYASGVHLPGISSMIEKSRRAFSIKTVQSPSPSLVIRRGVTYVDRIKFKSPVPSDRLTAVPDEEQGLPKEQESKKESEEITQALPFAIEEDLEHLLPKEEPPFSYGRGYRPTRKELISLSQLGEESSMAMPGDLDIALPVDFVQRMPGFTPKAVGGVMDSLKTRVVSSLQKSDAPVIKGKGGFTSLDEYLICSLFTYQDPGDGQKYFKLSIKAGKDAERLEKMPKEMIFLLDCSLSIQPERLEQIKKGLDYCLRHLNEGDIFNILAFREKRLWFRPSSIAPNEANIRDALRFVKGLTSGEVTDAYRALYDSIEGREFLAPCYIMLLSDGRPTYGVTDSREIINKITRVNKKERPIFAYSGGSRVNRYLLDFIAYKNRGWSEYAPNRYSIARYMGAFYDKIRDPLLLHLRYRFSGLDAKDVFPKSLPDFYRNAEFTLLGTYDDEHEFSMQLLGEIKGVINEFIIVGSLDKAQKANKDIARDWAFNKIYYLIGLLEYDRKNPAIIKEINELCKKFDIKTPYSDALKD